jgi:hypothetical protein
MGFKAGFMVDFCAQAVIQSTLIKPISVDLIIFFFFIEIGYRQMGCGNLAIFYPANKALSKDLCYLL